MPELPEVETIKLQLNRVLPGQTIKEVEVLSPKNFIGDKKKIKGKEILELKRFGKMLVFNLRGSLSLAVHLKMTGRLIYRGKKQPKKLQIGDPKIKTLPDKHTRVVIHFLSGDILYFDDLRKFGWMRIISQKEINLKREKLGIEPLTSDFTLENFRKVLRLSKKPIKLLLMDQEKIAGIGNIYANEALFLAKINPKVPANQLTLKQTELLFTKIIKELKNAIKWKGASDDAYLDAFGEKGEVQKHFLVYGKKGEKCPECKGKIEKIKMGGRGTYFCSQCQKF